MRTGNRPPSKDKPAIFTLRKKTEADPLIVVDRNVIVAKDGTPVEVSLQTGKPVPVGRGDLKIECWANDQNKDAKRHYDWSFRLSVPGGGLIERRNTDFDFEAPTDGYQAVEEFRMTRLADGWRDNFDKEYFVKLANNSYARLRFRITTGGDHFASITSYLNPSGSRNLEFDPKKVIRR